MVRVDFCQPEGADKRMERTCPFPLLGSHSKFVTTRIFLMDTQYSSRNPCIHATKHQSDHVHTQYLRQGDVD